MFNLSPKEDKFFDLFEEFSNIIYDASVKLRDLLDNLDSAEEKYKHIEDREHDGDKLLHDILSELNRSFITPIDREDIYSIAKSMDDILDLIEATASRFVLFNVDKASSYAFTVGDLIVSSCKELIKLMKDFRNMKSSKILAPCIIEINRLEDEGDTAFRVAVRSLFDGNTPALDVIKWREIYEHFEDTLDACEDIANIVEGVVMKHA